MGSDRKKYVLWIVDFGPFGNTIIIFEYRVDEIWPKTEANFESLNYKFDNLYCHSIVVQLPSRRHMSRPIHSNEWHSWSRIDLKDKGYLQ